MLLVSTLALVLLALHVPALAAVTPAATPTRTQDQALSSPGDVPDGDYGAAVAMDRDTMVVGAFDFFGSGSGAAYVYIWDGSKWAYQDTLTPSDGMDGDSFGYAVEIEGDTVVVGAPDNDKTANNAGAAYVYTRSGSTWSEAAVLRVDYPDASGDRLGEALALQDDTLLVGAGSYEIGGKFHGAVHVFVGSGADWKLDDTLVPSDPVGLDNFGSSAIAIDGRTALIGAFTQDSGAKDRVGAAYVFDREGDTWTERASKLTAPGEPENGNFGFSVALEGRTAIVGAYGIDGNRGAAYVFEDDGTGFSHAQTLSASDGASGDYFSEGLAMQGGLAVVGAEAADSGSGAAYVYRHDGSSWVEEEQLLASDSAGADGLGWACAISGDTVAVGAPWYPDFGGAGRVLLYEGMLGPYDPVELAGATRYETAIAASQEAFPNGADTVVIATGENWPDALGGAALAGAYDAPILLTLTATLPDAVAAEIDRLGASDAIILGGPGAVAPAVETALATKLGATNVRRLGGPTRYETAELIARAVKSEVGDDYEGTAFVATGLNFPDALAGSPLAAAGPWPIFLAPATGMTPSTLATMNDIGVTDVLILGGTGVVSQAIEDGFAAGVAGEVTRLAGPTRYETAVEVASFGVDEANLRWNGVALATGENFPDALAGGPVQGRARSVMLLTHTSFLTPATGSALEDEARDIATVRFLGGPGAIAQDVRDSVRAILE
jgi:putative cell wall-binding protein